MALVLKQGDPSVLRFKLGDFNDDELMLDPVATVYLSHENEVYRFEGTVHKDVVTLILIRCCLLRFIL